MKNTGLAKGNKPQANEPVINPNPGQINNGVNEGSRGGNGDNNGTGNNSYTVPICKSTLNNRIINKIYDG